MIVFYILGILEFFIKSHFLSFKLAPVGGGERNFSDAIILLLHRGYHKRGRYILQKPWLIIVSHSHGWWKGRTVFSPVDH